MSVIEGLARLVGGVVGLGMSIVMAWVIYRYGIRSLWRLWRSQDPVPVDGRHYGVVLMCLLGPSGGVAAAGAPWWAVAVVGVGFAVLLGLPLARGMPEWSHDAHGPDMNGAILAGFACLAFAGGVAVRQL